MLIQIIIYSLKILYSQHSNTLPGGLYIAAAFVGKQFDNTFKMPWKHSYPVILFLGTHCLFFLKPCHYRKFLTNKRIEENNESPIFNLQLL